jgi:hypothetical protein
MSNAPDVLFGLVPLVRATVRSATDATATTVTADDSGTLFINLSTSAHTYNLPAVADGKGKHWLFYDADTTAAMKVASTAANIMGVDSATGTTLTDGSVLGDCVLIIGDGTNYFAFVISGTWTSA